MCKGASEDVPVGDGKIPASLRALIPDHPASFEAIEIAEKKLPASILNHSFRTYLYAKAFLEVQEDDRAAIKALKTDYLSPVRTFFAPLHSIFVACILHDVGTASEFDRNPERFEITGADLIAQVLRRHGADEDLIHESWLAAVLHDTPGIPNHLGGSARAVRLGIQSEFGNTVPDPAKLPEGLKTKEAVEAELPRLDIEKILGDAVARQALLTPEKAPPGCWPGGLLKAKRDDPDWTGVNKGFHGY
ncbi:hypothetical protein GQ53DRAFT_511559 [Thozetella sp. PMI_491]|nr:hypothetical protein GQ53DRAFT_511559 [Thozetella sp. PMI_491]